MAGSGLGASGRVLHAAQAEDVASASNFRAFELLHLHLDLRAEFGPPGPGPGSRGLSGSAVLDLRCLEPGGAAELRLDSHPCVEVTAAALRRERPDAGQPEPEPEPVPVCTRPFSHYGQALCVLFPQPCIAGERLRVQLTYRVGEGPGVCWLAPEQTAGKRKPFVYTQGQAVLNRAFFPCFDTPAAKCTYSALLEVPDGFTAVMSANTWEKRGPNKFFFQMCQPIPSYLIALAIGDLVSAEVGPRSWVWAEPCLIAAAKEEYDGVIEEFLATGEKLFGPYVWGRYDVLFMPPSFPFGGMENPCLTFVTPCLLAGDRSLADVIIHEIAHSWFGNLVTNANWGEFWLNEGFTMYAQRRISTVLFGPAYTCLEAATGRALLRQHVDITGEEHPLNKLRVKLEPGVDPDDTYNETPYEKGFCFVSYLAHLVGDQDQFDEFLKAYVDEFKFQSVLTDDFLEFFLDYFPELKRRRVDSIPGFEFDRWLNTPGWPPYLPDLSPGDSLMRPAEELAQLWAAEELDVRAIEAVSTSAWKTYQLVYFLDKILQKSPLPPGHVKKLGEAYPKISSAQNAELRLRWGQIVLKNDHREDFWKVRDFLHSQEASWPQPVRLATFLATTSVRCTARRTPIWPLFPLPPPSGPMTWCWLSAARRCPWRAQLPASPTSSAGSWSFWRRTAWRFRSPWGTRAPSTREAPSPRRCSRTADRPAPSTPAASARGPPPRAARTSPPQGRALLRAPRPQTPVEATWTWTPRTAGSSLGTAFPTTRREILSMGSGNGAGPES
ncbi:aminopeptidase B isoform X4 [Physeter macrocephalus]|uniref:Aminopeptidase B isoform X4 n=1 Tax=Physeter macrocephalus TaxID=9755 RepID=A0A455B5Z8_PHYMC|nr:aminopeptidase B isoform X4 [Physeter catodon]|eukprot:XP_028344034.1 aminopeptidase B isoform X3 [Physeter catodon]